MKRKSELQLQALEKFYAGHKYPSHNDMEDLSMILSLTFKQIKGWFIEKRRRDKSKHDFVVHPPSSKRCSVAKGRNELGISSSAKKTLKLQDLSICDKTKVNTRASSKSKYTSSDVDLRTDKRKKKLTLVQDLVTPDYILAKVFRKDGPPLGVEFDSLPSKALSDSIAHVDSTNSQLSDEESLMTYKRRKVSMHAITDVAGCSTSAPIKHGIGKGFMTVWRATNPNAGDNAAGCSTNVPVKHGMGKGFMTAWRATNPNAGDFPTGLQIGNRKAADIPPVCPTPLKTRRQTKNRRLPAYIMKKRMLAKKLPEKRKPSHKRREVEPRREEVQKQLFRDKCELAIEEMISEERLNQFATLVDDEELELRDLQSGPNPVGCSDHCATNALHGCCSLCKDLLPKFPPLSVKTKQPFSMQPWDSSPEIVKKLFKVFHFLYTYSIMVDICPFTLDEFAQAFHDKDSLLLGKIHVALLKLLLSDVETEVSSGILPHSSVSCKFLALLHSVEDQQFIVEFWKKSLNPLTWIEILRQVLVAAGYGSKQIPSCKKALSKEMSLMLKYGLHLGTLKGELFRHLFNQGNNGLKVSDMAKSSQIVELDLATTTEELQVLICATLSSDITLFEKISPSAYRLRIGALTMEGDDLHSDMEDSGSVHDDLSDTGACSSSDSDCDSENPSPRKLKRTNSHESKSSRLTDHNEIDESHPGEVWLLGLMDGEYSDLSIEEKLNTMVALIDLLSSGSSIRMEDPIRPGVESVPSVHYGSGGKIKRSTSKQNNLLRPSWVHTGKFLDAKGSRSSSKFFPVDSSVVLKLDRTEKSSGKEKDTRGVELEVGLHPMQSIFLGSDRRYNRYWLFLGPCDSFDPGHKRLYVESSEDGLWEVIDTEEALRDLLSVLDDRGTREALLIESLERREASLCQEMSSKTADDPEIRQSPHSKEFEMEVVGQDSSSPVSDVDNNLSLTDITKSCLPPCSAIVLESGKKGDEESRKWKRLQEFDTWIWNHFYCSLNVVKHGKRSYFESLTRCETCHDLYWRDEKHCKLCHTTFELDFNLEERYAIHSATCRERKDKEMFPKHKVLSSHLQSLKAAVHAIESAMPEDALVGAWTKSAHQLWVRRLRRTSSVAELLQVVADFVAAINENWLYKCNLAEGSDCFMDEIVACFPNMPQTSSALALWLGKLDDLVSPYLEKVQSKQGTRTKTAGNLCL